MSSELTLAIFSLSVIVATSTTTYLVHEGKIGFGSSSSISKKVNYDEYAPTGEGHANYDLFTASEKCKDVIDETVTGTLKGFYYDDRSSRYDDRKNLNKVFYKLNIEMDNTFSKGSSYSVTFACHLAADTNELVYHNYYNFEKS